MDTKQPEALRLADKYEHEGFFSDQRFAQNQWCSHAAVELRRLHAENEALSNKLQTFEALGGAVDDLQLLRMGYAAARLEIESLQARLDASQKTNDDWAKRTHAMDAKNLGLLHALTAEQDENHALHQQLAAIGAGGVEPLRKRECLHKIIEPVQPMVWAIFAENGNCLMWTPDKSHAEATAKDISLQVTPLYAAPQPAAQAAPVEAENEIDLLAEAALCERLDACLAAARAAQGGV